MTIAPLDGFLTGRGIHGQQLMIESLLLSLPAYSGRCWNPTRPAWSHSCLIVAASSPRATATTPTSPSKPVPVAAAPPTGPRVPSSGPRSAPNAISNGSTAPTAPRRPRGDAQASRTDVTATVSPAVPTGPRRSESREAIKPENQDAQASGMT